MKLTSKNFEASVIESDVPVLVDFWADWCGPCKAIAPTIEAIAKKHKDKLVVGKVSVDEDPKLAKRFGVQAIPTLLLFKKGQVVAQLVGAVSRSAIEEELTKHI